MTDQELRDWVRLRLAALRRGTGLQKRPFAKLAKLSERHINKIEDGISSPTVETLSNWLYACNSSLGLFFAPLIEKQEKPNMRDNRRAHDGLDCALAQPTKAAGVRLMMDSFLLELSSRKRPRKGVR